MNLALRPILESAVLLILLPGATQAATRHPTFDERVRAQEAIERVHYEHQIGATRRFEEAVPRAAIETKVLDYMTESAALERLWHTPITTEALQAELERMARNTRYPDRLLEIYHALGNDPVVIRECFARPSLVDRMARSFFSFDQAIHAEARREAGDLDSRLRSGRLGIQASHPRRTLTEIRRADPRESARPPAAGARPSLTVAEGAATFDLPSGEFDRVRARAPHGVGEVGPLVEERDAFVLQVVLDESDDRVRIASYSVPKISWEAWSKDARPALADWKVGDATTDVGPVPLPRTMGPAGRGVNGTPGSTAPCDPDDTWDNGILDDFPADISGAAAAVWTGSEMVVMAPAAATPSGNLGGRYDPLTDTWRQVSMIGAPRILFPGQSMIWTGSEVLVWGGRWSTYQNVGGRYDPVADTWSAISTTNAPDGRAYHSAVWSGQVMVVWGGVNDTGELGTGGRYDPATDSWQPTSMVVAPDPRQQHTAVWAGSRMLVWGGGAGSTNLASGARYSPTTDTWSPISVGGPPPAPALHAAAAGGTAPAPRAGHVAVWTGTEMIVWGGSGGGSQLPGARYNPLSDSWTPMATDFQPWSIADKSAVWTGSRMLVWGGDSGFQNPGGLYDPSTDTWQRTSYANTPIPKASMPAVWTGNRMIVFAGGGAPSGRYDPVADSWTPATIGSAPMSRSAHAAIWTGNTMVVWGGRTYVDGLPTGTNTGGRYDPLTDSWTPTTTIGAPPAMQYPSNVWTGSVMVVWDGVTGGRYDPTLDNWQPFTSPGFPTGGHPVWTGSRMLVIGGQYDPATDTWTARSTVGAPAVLPYSTSVWTGSLMVVWGWDGNGLSSGIIGRYNPVTDSWSPLDNMGPMGRRDFTAVWTGTRLFVWGGYNDFYFNGSNVNDGGLYDPKTNTWQVVSTVSAPTSGYWASSIWTGSEVVVWGGAGTHGFPDRTGGRYDPAHNTWTPTTSMNAPSERQEHSAVWTGSFMVVWGGGSRTGGRYVLGHSVDQDGDGYSECAGDCNDGDPLMNPGAAEVCDGRDNNCNGLSDEDFGDVDGDQWGDACDCAPNDPSAFELPGVLGDLVWPSPSSFLWQPVAEFAGSGTVYDVVRGRAGEGPVGSGHSEACLVPGSPMATAADPSNPPTGAAFYYLVRARDACGTGGYGQASSGAERITSVCAP